MCPKAKWWTFSFSFWMGQVDQQTWLPRLALDKLSFARWKTLFNWLPDASCFEIVQNFAFLSERNSKHSDETERGGQNSKKKLACKFVIGWKIEPNPRCAGSGRKKTIVLTRGESLIFQGVHFVFQNGKDETFRRTLFCFEHRMTLFALCHLGGQKAEVRRCKTQQTSQLVLQYVFQHFFYSEETFSSLLWTPRSEFAMRLYCNAIVFLAPCVKSSQWCDRERGSFKRFSKQNCCFLSVLAAGEIR